GAYLEVVHELYVNIESADLDFDFHTLRSTIRGVTIELSALDIVDLLGTPIVSYLQYPFSTSQSLRDVEIRRELTGGAHYHRSVLREDNLTPHYRVLHHIVASFIDLINPLSDISISRCYLLHGISQAYTFDFPHHIWILIARFGNSPIHGLGIPFCSIITHIYNTRFAPTYGNELFFPPPCEIFEHTYCSTTLSPNISSLDIHPAPIPEPQYPDLEPAFTHPLDR
ncbi:hypothetical protein U1Q18_017952, partial [Sarracenia purpurea var. burkii]